MMKRTGLSHVPRPALTRVATTWFHSHLRPTPSIRATSGGSSRRGTAWTPIAYGSVYELSDAPLLARDAPPAGPADRREHGRLPVL